jgi:RHS repeat-associated protein
LVTIERTLEILPPGTTEDVVLHEPDTIPQEQDERRLGGYSFDVYSTTNQLTMTGGTITGPIPWDPFPASDYSLFAATPGVVTQPTDALISITKNGMKDHERVVVVPSTDAVILRSVSIDSSVIGGADAVGWVELNQAAPAGGLVVNLSGTRTGLATVPTSVTVPEGETGVAFTVTTQATSVKRGVHVRATYAAQLRTANVAIQPSPSLRSPETTDSEVEQAVNTSTRSSMRSARTVSPELNPAAETEPAMLTRYSFYTPELQLMAQTELTTDQTPSVEHEYIWFAGQPVAQIANATGAIAWYFNDHLGTPILQTDAAANVIWRVEREPYGRIYHVRAGASRYQPLAFPGQEDDGGEMTYNIFRWYRAGWARYTQADPLGTLGDANPYQYAMGTPLTNVDPLGLYTVLKASPGEKVRIDNAIQKLLQEMTNSPDGCKDCVDYFKGLNQFTDIKAWTQQGGAPYLRVLQTPAGGGRAHSQKGSPWTYTFLYENNFPPSASQLSECRLASLILHEVGHLARQDTTDNEPQEFFSKCQFGCINPGEWH